MSTNEFDGLIKDKFDDGAFEYKPPQWEKLSRQLDATTPPARRRYSLLLPLSGIAASVALLAGFFLWYNNVQQHASSPAPVAVSQPVGKSVHSVNPLPIARGTDQNAATILPTASRKNIIATTKKQATPHAVNFTSDNNNDTPVIADNTTVVPNATVTDTGSNATNKRSTQVAAQQHATKTPMIPQFSEDAFVNSKAFAQNSFGLTGGVNYGSFNTGYTAGVNGRRKLGNKLYIEGDLAFVSSNPSQVATTNKTAADAFVNAGSGGMNAFEPVTARNNSQAQNNLYYLQIAPSIGYALSKKFSVSVGGDIQRLLQSNESTALQITDEDIKEVPQTDIGMQGKAEYSVTRKLKAGVTYREGINSLIDPKYLDRRYLQVQLKFVIFGGKK